MPYQLHVLKQVPVLIFWRRWSIVQTGSYINKATALAVGREMVRHNPKLAYLVQS